MWYAWRFKVLSVVLVGFKCVLDEDWLEVGRYFGFLNHEVEVEGFTQEFLGLEFNLVIHFFTEINLPGFIRGDEVNYQLSAMIILANNGQFHGVIKHIRKCLRGKEAPSNQRMFRWIPKRIILLVQCRYYAGLEILFGHVFNDIVTIWELIDVPPVGIANLPVDYLDFDGAFFHIDLAVLALGVEEHHFNAHGNVAFELFGDEV